MQNSLVVCPKKKFCEPQWITFPLVVKAAIVFVAKTRSFPLPTVAIPGLELMSRYYTIECYPECTAMFDTM